MIIPTLFLILMFFMSKKEAKTLFIYFALLVIPLRMLYDHFFGDPTLSQKLLDGLFTIYFLAQFNPIGRMKVVLKSLATCVFIYCIYSSWTFLNSLFHHI